MKSNTFLPAAATGLLLATVCQAQVVLTDIGTTAPTAGVNDISQFGTGGGSPSSLNYYWDDGYTTPTTGAPGQTFTTLNNPQGYTLTSISILTSGNGGGNSLATPTESQPFMLNVYELSNPLGVSPVTSGLTNATLIASYTATGQLLAQGDWMKWTGLGVPLSPGTNYGFTFGISAPPGGHDDWEQISTATGLPYSGGQACLIPNAGGKIKYSGSLNNYDMTFDVGLSLPAAPVANAPLVSPSSAGIATIAGANVSLTATAGGSAPITFTWYTDGGTGGAFTNIPGANSSNLVVNTAGFAPGVYQYDFLASNSLGTNMSSAAAITIVSVLMADIGSSAPTPGPLDISQLLNTSQADDGFNYYTDNGANNNLWCGQTFTTGTNLSGYVMNSLSFQTAGNGNSFNAFQLYDFRVFSLNLAGTTATLVASYTNYGGGNQSDWFEWEGISVPLAPNSLYAYTIGKDSTASGWEHLADQGGNPYAGGQLCEIAATGGTVHYGNAGTSDSTFDIGLTYSLKPYAFAPTYTPNVSPIYAQTMVTLQESAVGPQPLYYQWLADNGTGTLSLVNGANGTNLTVDTSAFAPGNYEYAVVVTNSSGASTSAVTTLSVIASSAPSVTTDITPTNLNEGYVGGSVTFSAAFTGTLPITYQWLVDTGSGPTAISSAGNPSAISNTLVLTNLQLANAGTYSVAVANSVGTNVSTSSTLVVFADQLAPAAGTYGAMILTNDPVAYWRLDDTNDNPSDGVAPAYDSSGHHFDGVYGILSEDGFDGIAGPQSPAFPGFETNNGALYTFNGAVGDYVTVPPINLDTNSVTITMWINPLASQATFEGLFFNRNGPDAAGLGFGGSQNTSGMTELGYTWNTNSSTTWSFNSGLYPVPNVWSFVALVVQTNQATIYLYYIDPNTGQPDLYSAVNPVPHSVEKFSGGTTTIGSDPATASSRIFSGDIDEVAVFNKAFTGDQILQLFAKGAGLSEVAASIAGQPQSVGAYAGKTVSFTATGVNGSAPLSYQWQFDGANLTNGPGISGATTASLTISNVTEANAGTYQLFIKNPVDTTPSSAATLVVVSPVPDSYEASVIADNPLLFWKLAETNADPASGSAVAYDYVNGYNGTYGTGTEDGYPSYDIAGPQSPEFPGFPTNNTAMETFVNVGNSFLSASAGTLATNTVTYAMWIYPIAGAPTFAGLLMNRSGPAGGNGLGFGGDTDANGMADLGYTWNNNNSDTWSFSSELFPIINQWNFVAMTIDPTQATLYLINSNGVQTAVNAIAHDSEEFGVAWRLGGDAQDGGNGSRTFPGSISSASVYLSALSSNQLASLYNAGLQIAPPVSLNIARGIGANLTLSWSQGTLLQATNLAGPWVSNSAAVSPYAVSATNSQIYFKVRVQ